MPFRMYLFIFQVKYFAVIFIQHLIFEPVSALAIQVPLHPPNGYASA